MKNNIPYKVVRRNVKYPRVEIKTGDLVVVAPNDAAFDVDNFVNRHTRWIEEKFEFIKKIKNKFQELKLDEKSTNELKDFVLKRVEDFGEEIKADPNKIRLIEMKTKWGSCSSAGNLTFNKLLRFLPEEVIEYVIYHEMCHLKYLKHNKGFWDLIEKKYSDHKKFEEKLFGYWFLISRN